MLCFSLAIRWHTCVSVCVLVVIREFGGPFVVLLVGVFGFHFPFVSLAQQQSYAPRAHIQHNRLLVAGSSQV